VSAGAPQLDSIFPASVIAGPTVDPVVTIYGDNFFATSVVTLQQAPNPPITLTSTLLSRKVLQATIKAAYLTAAGAWTLAVTNPAPPNNPSQASPYTTFTVTSPTTPAITSVVNSASYFSTAIHTGTGASPAPTNGVSVSPREILSIFGKNLGPTSVTNNTASGTPPAYGTVAGSVQVWFDYTGNTGGMIAAPIIMTSANQVNCLAPIELAAVIGTAGPNATVVVQNGVNFTATYPLTVVSADPGIFTFGGLGQGQGAVLNFDSTTGSYVINGSKAAAPKGSTISVYATGLGDLATPTIGAGEVVSTAIALGANTVRIDIDGQPAVVTYAGTSPGAVSGLVQINAIVPPTVRSGAAIPLTVSIGSAAASRRSQPGVTIAVK
jgi:uncharacterized protein (TIGR03437 family)